MKKGIIKPKEGPIQVINEIDFFFEEYQVLYYSQSSSPWEAAKIECFEKTVGEKSGSQVGSIVFTYPNKSLPPGQENVANLPTNVPLSQFNHLESRTYISKKPNNFFVIHSDTNPF